MTPSVMTYNVHGLVGQDGIFDPQRIDSLLNSAGAAVISLQEVRDLEDAANSLCRARHRLWAPTLTMDGAGYGNLLLSTWPITGAGIHDISEKDAEPRNVIDALIETPAGALRVLCTHLGLRRTERRRQMRQLLRLLDRKPDLPTVLMGDFNAWRRTSPVLAGLRQRMGDQAAPASFPARLPVAALDRIWGRPPRILGRPRSLKEPRYRRASDHLPVMAALRL